MQEKPIEARIREYYVADNGEWLVEKGKTKEAKLLKEACETLEKLRKDVATSDRQYYNLLLITEKKKQELEEREAVVAKREVAFEERKAGFIKNFQEWV